jgi:hypothetical protein
MKTPGFTGAVVCLRSVPILMAVLLLPMTVSADAPSMTAFGLRVEAKANTALAADDNGFPVAVLAPITSVPAPTPPQAYGMRIFLGEADSGIFGYPETDYNSEDYAMQGAAYGKLDGQPNQLLTSVRADLAYESYTYDGATYVYHLMGTYMVLANLSPLGASSLTYALYMGATQVVATTASSGQVFVDFYRAGYWGRPRVNPFWRMPDGSVGVLIELNNAARVVLPGQDIENTWQTGNRIFIRANNPTHKVAYVSHVDATASVDLPWFSLTDARLGVFHRPHKALGQITFDAADGQLTLNNIGAGDSEGTPTDGVAVELNGAVAFAVPWVVDLTDGAGSFAAALAPLRLETNGARLCLQALTVGGGNGIGTLELVRADGTLRLLANLAGNQLGVVVYNQGQKVGQVVLPESARTLSVLSPSMVAPAITACGARAASASGPAGYSLHFDHLTVFALSSGLTLAGDEIQFQALQTAANDGGATLTNSLPAPSLQTFLLTAAQVPAITIVGETLCPLEVPAISQHREGDLFVVSWCDPNQIYILESGPSVQGPFTPITSTYDPLTQSGRAALDLREMPTRLFFRLRSTPYHD